MYSFVSIRVISWLKNLPAAEGGLAKKSVFIREIRGPKICRRQISCIFCAFSWPFVAKKSSRRLLSKIFSGLFFELAGFFEIPDQHIHGQ